MSVPGGAPPSAPAVVALPAVKFACFFSTEVFAEDLPVPLLLLLLLIVCHGIPLVSVTIGEPPPAAAVAVET